MSLVCMLLGASRALSIPTAHLTSPSQSSCAWRLMYGLVLTLVLSTLNACERSLERHADAERVATLKDGHVVKGARAAPSAPPLKPPEVTAQPSSQKTSPQASKVPKTQKAQAPQADLGEQTPLLITNSPKPPIKNTRWVASADIIPGDAQVTRLAVRALSARWSEAHTLRVGPIPDYAPMKSVYFHTQLAGLAPETSLALEVLIAELTEIDDYDPGEQPLEGEEPSEEGFVEDTMLLWMRDYHPIYVRRPTGDLRAVHYLAHNPNRARYLLKGAPRVDEVTQLPLIHENGNLIIAGQWAFVSERIVEDNAEAESEEHLVQGGYRPRGRAEIKGLLSELLLIPPEKVVILPSMPHEATGHVDLYLMAINDHQVIIPKIVMPLEHFSTNPVERDIAQDVKTFLDERAQQLASLGLEVIRLPQIPPLYLPALDEPEGNFDVVFYSPTNGLLVNKGAEQLVLLPHFEANELRPELKAMSDAYERFWRETFTAFGWPAYMVDVTLLGRYLGLIHCVTATTPQLPLRDAWRALKGLPPLPRSSAPVKTRDEKTSSPKRARVASQTKPTLRRSRSPINPSIQAPQAPQTPHLEPAHLPVAPPPQKR